MAAIVLIVAVASSIVIECLVFRVVKANVNDYIFSSI